MLTICPWEFGKKNTNRRWITLSGICNRICGISRVENTFDCDSVIFHFHSMSNWQTRDLRDVCAVEFCRHLTRNRVIVMRIGRQVDQLACLSILQCQWLSVFTYTGWWDKSVFPMRANLIGLDAKRWISFFSKPESCSQRIIQSWKVCSKNIFQFYSVNLPNRSS